MLYFNFIITLIKHTNSEHIRISYIRFTCACVCYFTKMKLYIPVYQSGFGICNIFWYRSFEQFKSVRLQLSCIYDCFLCWLPGPRRIRQNLEGCSENQRCIRTCLNNFLTRRASTCLNMPLADVSCDDMTRLFHAGPFACPRPQQQFPFLVNAVNNCCNGVRKSNIS